MPLTDRQFLDQLKKKFEADAIHYADSEICDALRIGEIRRLLELASAHLDLIEGLKSNEKLLQEFYLAQPIHRLITHKADLQSPRPKDFCRWLLSKLEEK